MSLGHIIPEVGEQRESSEGWGRLNQEFFLSLHHNEVRYVKLKYGRKSKDSEKELSKLIMDLVTGYTECIDYFGTDSDPVVAYFQIKIKEVNRYYQFLNTQVIQTPESKQGVPSTDSRKDLGSISEQTGPQLLPQEDRQLSVVGKEALNHHVMVCLQSQDIKSHITQNKKKQEKMLNTIAENLKQQQDMLSKRKRMRKSAIKNRIFLSFSQRNLDQSRYSDCSEIMFADMDALEANSPQQLKNLAMRLDRDAQRDEQIQGIGQSILQILQHE